MEIASSALGTLRKAVGLSSHLIFKKAEKDLPVEKFDRAEKPGSCFTVGFGKASILPKDVTSKKYYIAGYGANKPAQGVLDAPHAHAVWIDDNTGRGGVVFVSIDDVGMLKKDVDALRASLADFCRESGCRSISVMSTHNHAGIDTMGIWGELPFTGRNPHYIELVFSTVRKSVHEAYRSRCNGKLLLGEIEVPDMQEDIRLPEVYSKTLTRIRFVPDNGGREIYLLNFASHSESLGGSNVLVSADFPCYLRERIREKTGAETIYFVGAIGGMISMNNESDSPEITMDIGRRLADYALAIENELELEARVDFMRQEFFFEADNLVLMLAAQAKILQVDKYKATWSSTGYALKSEMSYFEIGSKKLLLLPGELFPELAYGGYLTSETSAQGKGEDINPAPLTKIAGDDSLMFFGLANDEVGYIIPPNDFMLDETRPYLEHAYDRHSRKHYEETNSLGPHTADRIAEIFSAMMKEVKASKA